MKLEEVRALRRATDCPNKDQLPSQSMIAWREKDFARRDMLRLGLECSEKTFIMEAYLIPRIGETTYKDV
jgi:hypothetical protein